MSFVIGLMSGALTTLIGLALIVAGLVILDWLMDTYVAPMIYQPRLIPFRMRTAEEQRQYDDCNRTLRPGHVRYAVRVKPDPK
jgi:hypothetical protein